MWSIIATMKMNQKIGEKDLKDDLQLFFFFFQFKAYLMCQSIFEHEICRSQIQILENQNNANCAYTSGYFHHPIHHGPLGLVNQDGNRSGLV